MMLHQANAFDIQPTATCHFFVKGAMQFLVPIILETLTKQVCTSNIYLHHLSNIFVHVYVRLWVKVHVLEPSLA
jgi:hypothetical protein